jgi:PKD repeat protein
MSFSIFAAAVSRRISRSLFSVALLGAASLPLAAQATTWVTTSSHAFPLGSSVVTSPLPTSTPLHVYVSLQHQNQADLQATMKNLFTPGNPQFGRYLTPAQFVAAYAPTTAQVQSVTDYLTANGFSNISVSSNRMLVTADATTGNIQKAFNTQIAQFALNGKMVHAAVADVQVPSALGGIVQSVLGLQNAYQKVKNISQTRHIEPSPYVGVKASAVASQQSVAASATTNAAGTPTLIATYTAAGFRTAYDEGTTPDGSMTRVVISTEGNDMTGVISDLRIAEQDANLPFIPVNVKISAPLPSPVDDSGDDEWDLDSQYLTGIAYNVHDLTFLVATDLGDSLIGAYNDFVADPTYKVGNMSYGGCEVLDGATGGLTANDDAFMQATMQGQTWFASAGDAGAACSVLINLGTPDTGIPDVECPACSPYVVAVGGTSLETDANFNYVTELTWTGTGGGTSLFETAPSWQTGIVPTSAATATLRGVPDIAMNSGLNVGPVVFYDAADVIVDGAHESVIGTSLASPLAVGVWSRFLSAHCEDASYGFAAPMIYALDTSGLPLSTATGFNDVTVGSNGAFEATPGWDFTTGFGSFDITAVNKALPPVTCAVNNPPVPVLTADVTSGTGPLTVNFNGSGSSDPDKDAIADYIIDFGDGSPVVFSTVPAIPAHTYANAGPYTASLTVRDARGAASVLASTLNILVAGTPLACVLPGQLLLTSPEGNPSLEGVDPEMGNGSDDLLSSYIAEPADQTDELVFTINVVSLATVPVGFRWVTYFTIPDGTLHYVSMTTSSSTTPDFTYGVHGYVPVANLSTFQESGTADAASNFNANGTIQIFVPRSAFNLNIGDKLTAISSSVRVSTADDPTGSVGAGAGLTVDSGGDPYPYTVVGNNVCAADIAGTTTGGTTTGGTTGATTGTTGSTTGTILPITSGTGTTEDGRLSSGGAFGEVLIPLAGLLALRRRKRSAQAVDKR